PKRKPKVAAPKDNTKDAGSATAAASGDGTPAKPKPKKPESKPVPMTIAPAVEQSSPAREARHARLAGLAIVGALATLQPLPDASRDAHGASARRQALDESWVLSIG